MRKFKLVFEVIDSDTKEVVFEKSQIEVALDPESILPALAKMNNTTVEDARDNPKFRMIRHTLVRSYFDEVLQAATYNAFAVIRSKVMDAAGPTPPVTPPEKKDG